MGVFVSLEKAALVGILGRGGLSSLYAGWGAVLCRNIPHSIIKFYTYETLKRLLLPSTQPNARPSTCQTLICGGLAGSTAALFTTPFDVVKTRLQTQIPGSLCKYDGVFHALQEISKQEGLKGLYRFPTLPVVELQRHQSSVNAIAWAPHSSCHICTAGDDSQALIWDLSSMGQPVEGGLDPILAYTAGAEIEQLQWSSSQPDWVAIAFSSKLQILRV